MKYFCFGLLIFSVLFAFTFGADCKYGDHEFSVGEKYQPSGECIEVSCEEPNSMTAKGCPSIDSLKPCKYIPMDESKPYPQCCPTFDC